MDNFNNAFTAKMSDGRFITDYSPNCELNNKYQKNMTSFQYRTFITNNTTNIMDNERDDLFNKYLCNSCQGNNEVLPKYEQKCNLNGKCNLNIINQNGIGLF